ncbi:MAG: sulfurtransferase [Woeseia sp.]|nr:sulfurtransferase [Woeseia sp.]
MNQINELITAEELHPLIVAGEVRVVDCRFNFFDTEKGRHDYFAGHIPSANYADMDHDLSSSVTEISGRHPLPDTSSIHKTLEGWGISDGSHVVVYDEDNGALAVRLWWMLRYWLGHPHVSVLDGGLAAWVLAGYETSTLESPRVRGRYTRMPDDRMVVSTQDIVSKIQKGEGADIIDARDGARFRGENEPIDEVAGHIPGAKSFPLTTNLKKNGAVKNGKQLAEAWSLVIGERDIDNAVVMCGSGITACHLVLTAKLAGLDAPRLYVGSWSEWIRDPDRPVEVGDGVDS